MTQIVRIETMDVKKRKRLEAKGWKVGSTEDFLGLTPAESVYIELRLELSKALKERREKSHLTQVEAAKILKSSQSRVAKMEQGNPSVSVDLLIRSLLTLGATRKDLARIIA